MLKLLDNYYDTVPLPKRSYEGVTTYGTWGLILSRIFSVVHWSENMLNAISSSLAEYVKSSVQPDFSLVEPSLVE